MTKRKCLQTLSWFCLVGTVLPAVLFLAGRIPLEQSRTLLLLATIGWFSLTPFWMGRSDRSESVEPAE